MSVGAWAPMFGPPASGVLVSLGMVGAVTDGCDGVVVRTERRAESEGSAVGNVDLATHE